MPLTFDPIPLDRGQVVRWSGGQVVRWSGGQVVRWSAQLKQAKKFWKGNSLATGDKQRNHESDFDKVHWQDHSAQIESDVYKPIIRLYLKDKLIN